MNKGRSLLWGIFLYIGAMNVGRLTVDLISKEVMVFLSLVALLSFALLLYDVFYEAWHSREKRKNDD